VTNGTAKAKNVVETVQSVFCCDDQDGGNQENEKLRLNCDYLASETNWVDREVTNLSFKERENLSIIRHRW